MCQESAVYRMGLVPAAGNCDLQPAAGKLGSTPMIQDRPWERFISIIRDNAGNLIHFFGE